MGVDKSVHGIRQQCKFCMELMRRLHADVQSGEPNRIGCDGLEGHTRMREDIRRLRRELMTLQKQLDPWG